MHENFYLPQPQECDTMGKHPIFEKARALQHSLRHTYHDTATQAQSPPGDQLRQIHLKAVEDGLWLQPVQLSGRDITVPIMLIDKQTGMQTLTGYSQQEVPFDSIGDAAPVEGQFYGFVASARYDDNEQAFYTDIQQQIIVQKDVTFNLMSGALCAYGAVDSTTLTFRADTRNAQYVDSYNTLLDAAHSAQTTLATVNLGRLLNPSDKSQLYTPSRIRSIGRVVRVLEKSRETTDIHTRDTEIDLLSAKFGIDPGSSKTFAVRTLVSHMRKNSRNFFAATPFTSKDFSVSSLSFVPHTKLQEGAIKISRSEETIAFSAHTKPDETRYHSLHIPLEKIQSLQPLDQEDAM